jgi:poly(hydroxyalkanoate) depolymerase family esterase
MFTWLMRRMRALRTWILVRLGLWRRQWRRTRVRVPGARLLWGRAASHTWGYGLYTPAGLADSASAPLIVLLHGCRQRALGFAYASGWTDVADRLRVRLLCPDQRRLANLFRCWNWFQPAAQRGQGELAVIIAMIDDAATQVRVDENTVAAVGLSAGGALAALLAFHCPERFRAVAAVASPPLLGSLGTQNPQGVMRRGLALSPLLALGASQTACAPLAIIHGADDQVVHPRCAEQLLAQAIESNRRAGIHLEKIDAGKAPANTTVADYQADERLRLRYIEVAGLGHTWTGGPGGHPYCERGGVRLAEACAQFLRDAGMFRR